MGLDASGALLGLIALLDGLGVRYAIGGSLASSLFGEPRTTHDADLLVALTRSRLAPFLAAVRPTFYVPDDGARQAVDSCTAFNLLHLETGHKLDLFVAGDSPLDVAQLERSRLVALDPGGRTVRVTSPEVLVLRKLAKVRSRGEISERQWRDVIGILRVQGDRLGLDEARALAARCDLTDLLERAVRAAGT